MCWPSAGDFFIYLFFFAFKGIFLLCFDSPAYNLHVWNENYININPNIQKLYCNLRSFRLHAPLLQTNVINNLTNLDKFLDRKEEKKKCIVTHHLIKLDFLLLFFPTSLFQMHLNEWLPNYFHQRCKAPVACEGNSRRGTGIDLGCK